MDFAPLIEKRRDRMAEIEKAMAEEDFYSDQKRAAEASQEYTRIKELLANWDAFSESVRQLEDNRELAKGDDEDGIWFLTPLDNTFDLDSTDLNVDSSDVEFMITSVLVTSFGDANLDGVFNSSDLVLVFQTGEYEDLIVGNSTWVDGDWNCDGEFTTADLVVAFQSGRYTN